MNEHGHDPAIVATGLRKAYGDKVVLDGIDLNVPAGTIFSLLGPNGAGRTRDDRGVGVHAGPVEWVAAIGLLLALTLALTWLAVAFGLVASRPEAASNLPLPLILLPFIGSGFVRTDSMPAGIREFAEYQPFTPINETLRGLLMGTPVGHNGVVALAWCAGIALVGYLWAKKLFTRDPGH